MTSAKLLMGLKTAAIVGFLAILPAFLIAPSAEAQFTDSLDLAQGETDLEAVELPVLIGRLINIALSFLGVIFLVLIIWAGFLWMTAGGKPEQTDKAKKMLINATIGLILILAAFAISSFVLGSVGESIG